MTYDELKWLAVPEFTKFPKIPRLDNLEMEITQKMDGTNAQILISPDDNGDLEVWAGSRNRWLTENHDNFGFAKFVKENETALIELLGEGRHFGEWCGPGINSGEGLPEKTLFLFNADRWGASKLIPRVQCVPRLYVGRVDLSHVELAMRNLATHGSMVVRDFMEVEGVVVKIGNLSFKELFKREDKPVSTKQYSAPIDVTNLLQPERLKKLLSKDEDYLRRYPESLSEIAQEYVLDLEVEGQLTGTKEEMKALKKGLGKVLFVFIKEYMKSPYWRYTYQEDNDEKEEPQAVS